MTLARFGIALGLLLAACNGKDTGGSTTRVDDILALTGDAGAGGSTYGTTCAVCHGAAGEGGGGGAYPALAGTTRGEDVLAQTIIDGGEIMAPYGDTYDDQQIADLVAFILTL